MEQIYQPSRQLRVRTAAFLAGYLLIASSQSYTAEGLPNRCVQVEAAPNLNPNILNGDGETREEFADAPTNRQESDEEFGHSPTALNSSLSPLRILESYWAAKSLDTVELVDAPRTGLVIKAHYSSSANYEIPLDNIEKYLLMGLDYADYSQVDKTRIYGDCYLREMVDIKRIVPDVVNVYFAENAAHTYYRGGLVNRSDVPEGADAKRGYMLPSFIDPINNEHHIGIAPGALDVADTDAINRKVRNILIHEGVHLAQAVGMFAHAETPSDYEDIAYELTSNAKRAISAGLTD